MNNDTRGMMDADMRNTIPLDSSPMGTVVRQSQFTGNVDKDLQLPLQQHVAYGSARPRERKSLGLE